MGGVRRTRERSGRLSALADTVQVYVAASRNPSLRRVVAAFLCFTAAEYGVWLAVTLYAYERGGASTAGLVLVAQLIPAALVAPFGSVLGDRVGRDRALTLGYAIQAAAYLACGLALWWAPAPVAYAAAVLASCTVTLTRPVHHAIVPELAETPEELTAANSLSGVAEGIGILLGPAVNSVLVAISGPVLVVTAFAAVSVLAAALTLHLRAHAVAGDDADAGVEPDRIVRAAVEGFHELRRDRGAAALTVLGGAQFVLLGMMDVLFVVLAIEVLRRGEESAGLLAAAMGIGGLAGAAATALLMGRRRLAAPIELGLGVTGGGIAAIAGVTAFGPVMVLLACSGAGRAFFDVAVRTLLQRSVKDEVLSRVFGLQEGISMLGLAIGAAAVPILVSLVGVEGALVVSGGFLPVAGVLALGTLRSLDRRAALPDPAAAALLRAIPLFRPLPQPAFELVASRLIPSEVPADAEVIREGDPGDRFFAIVDGEAAVTVAGREIARLGPGDYAGEIALLRDVPRTATVTALTDLRLLALEREDFLAAVTGSRPSAEAAAEVVERRLSQQGREGD
jgi:hypothetical protein